MAVIHTTLKKKRKSGGGAAGGGEGRGRGARVAVHGKLNRLSHWKIMLELFLALL